ncbi:MAG: tRNA threonylcarbamoyladenosine dehydratase [Clostridia bacterium]|nr:tRNA threonylcarbamoyladenosine dehydratase [Clostridia bacterium]
MERFTDRTEMMLGEEAITRLKGAHVAVFGIGGVGGYATEALARAGIGRLTLIDADRVSISNINRQIIATHSTVGMPKVEAAKARLLDINPDIRIDVRQLFFDNDTLPLFDFSSFTYVIDAIDTLRQKLLLIESATRQGCKIISAMGAGNKLDPTRFRVSDIYKTSGDPLARAVRTELRKRGINRLKVVYSDEQPTNPTGIRTPGSLSFVPSIMGLIIAGEVIKDIALPPKQD